MTQQHSFANVSATQRHEWITVVNPTNRRMLLQACDNCGVVKSENTVARGCTRPAGEGVITKSMNQALRLIA